MSEIEFKLSNWRDGNVAAERMAGAILHLEGFSSVDPQCPLGGPDGGKDLLCQKNNWQYVAAAYFPTTNKEFKDIKSKFEGDLAGVKKNKANGIVFLTNQKLTPGERSELEKLAEKQSHLCILYHIERILGILSSPAGYGVRLQYLGIPMTTEEQVSFFSRWDTALSDKLHENSLLVIRELSKKIDSLSMPLTAMQSDIGQLSEFAQRTTAAIGELVKRSNKAKIPAPFKLQSTRSLSVETICTWHRAIMLDTARGGFLPGGVLRDKEVWIGKGSASIEDAIYVPPPPDQVPKQLEALCDSWNGEYERLLTAKKQEIIKEIAKFHHGFLHIHPFIDGNGRLARFILAQQAFELLGITRKIVIEDRRPYLDSLSNADNGDSSDLEREITQVLFGVEFVSGSPCQMSGQICPNCGNGILDLSQDQEGVECPSCSAYYPASS
jgi:hypothetical protein